MPQILLSRTQTHFDYATHPSEDASESFEAAFYFSEAVWVHIIKSVGLDSSSTPQGQRQNTRWVRSELRCFEVYLRDLP